MTDCDVFVFVDSAGKPNGGEEVLSPMISLVKPEGAVLIVLDADGDSGLVIGMVCGCWSMSGLGCAYEFILQLSMLVGGEGSTFRAQRLSDGTHHERLSASLTTHAVLTSHRWG